MKWTAILAVLAMTVGSAGCCCCGKWFGQPQAVVAAPVVPPPACDPCQTAPALPVTYGYGTAPAYGTPTYTAP